MLLSRRTSLITLLMRRATLTAWMLCLVRGGTWKPSIVSISLALSALRMRWNWASGFSRRSWPKPESPMQPQTNMALLKGRCSKDTPDWYEEGTYQHHVATYLNLLGGTSITEERLAPVRPRRNRRRPGAPAISACLRRGSR